MVNNIKFKKRNLWIQALLTVITFGVYFIYWIGSTTSELKKYDKKTPSFLYFILSIVGVYILIILSLFVSENLLLGVIFLILILILYVEIFVFLFRYSKTASRITQNETSKWIGFILLFVPLGFLSFQNIYNKNSRKRKSQIPQGEYIVEVEKSKISPNEEIAKDYILQYKNSYSKDVLERGLVNNSIPLNDAKNYLNKYYVENTNNINNNNYENTQSKIRHNKKGLGQFFTRIYLWMFIGLITSIIAGLITMYTPLFYFIYGSATIYYGIVGIEIILLFGTQLLIEKFSPSISLFLFLLYAFINGITLVGLFLMYTLESIFTIFFVAASMFLLLAFIGFITKKNLSGMGKFFIVGMWGIFFVSILNILFQSSNLDFIVSIIAVIVFSGLTVYDNQVYKNVYKQIKTKEDFNKYSVLGALHMYINFIMIFVNLLKLFGSRR